MNKNGRSLFDKVFNPTEEEIAKRKEFEDKMLKEIELKDKEFESKNKCCSFCKETRRSRIKNITITINYTDPLAYGYPEIVNWNEKHKLENCPKCGRKLTYKEGEEN